MKILEKRQNNTIANHKMKDRIITILLIFISIFSYGQEIDTVYSDINEALKNPDNVKELRINSNNGIFYLRDFEQIGQFKNLEVLEISECRLIGFPNSISELKKLRVFRFKWNYGIGQEKINWEKEIKKLCCLKKLEILDLSYYNLIEKLPSEIKCLKNLKILNLWTATIFELPKEIGELTNLELLNIGQTGISTLPKEIENLKNLKKIIVDSSKITKIEIDRIKMLLPNCKIE